MSTFRADTLTDKDGNNSIAQSVVYSGTAKAWSNLNGSGTIAARDDYAISSYTDVGSGHYDFNLAVTMSDANYNTVAAAGEATTAFITISLHSNGSASRTTPTTTSFRVAYGFGISSGNTADADYANATVFGDLA